MEKKLTQRELLANLIHNADNPFTTSEQKHDILHVLETSSNFKGMNHLFLVECYFHPEKSKFYVSEGKALTQAYLALKENNVVAYYYLYRLLKKTEPQKARNHLRMAVVFHVPEATLEMAKIYDSGGIFPKNQEEAFRYYKEAVRLGKTDGYFGMLLIAANRHDIELEKQIFEEAKEHQVHLPGVVE